jgi:FKBP-type peptidyl-prolyl cis-trans isomerase SlyD
VPDSDLAVADDMVVGIAYQLRLDDGDLIDEASSEEPFEFLYGHGKVIPGLEMAIGGLKVGQVKKVTVAPADGYGEVNADDSVLVPFDTFPEDLKLEEGLALLMHDSNTQEPVQAFVSEILDDGVVMDLNHPLAGETLFFEVEVLSLRQPTDEEMTHGHVHGAGHEH